MISLDWKGIPSLTRVRLVASLLDFGDYMSPRRCNSKWKWKIRDWFSSLTLLRLAQGALLAQDYRKRLEAMLFLHNKCMKDLNSDLCLPRVEGSYFVKQVGPSPAVLPLSFQAVQFGRVKLRGQTGCFLQIPQGLPEGRSSSVLWFYTVLALFT